MGFFTRLKSFGFGGKQKSIKVVGGERRCRFETMEERRMLDADPVVAGATYVEGDTGEDFAPDYFEVTFEGGSATTQLTQFVINGDQDGNGVVSDGDMLFDVDANQPGTSGYHGFKFDALKSFGLTADDIESVNVSDDGLVLTVGLRNFEAGDKLAFSIDVDEVERHKLDKIASGVEFEGTTFQASFQDEHYTFVGKSVSVNHQLQDGYNQLQTSGIFFDEYDSLVARGSEIAGANLDLHADAENNQADRNDAAIVAYDLVPKPITISGRVYHDADIDCNQDAGEEGIGNVDLLLQRYNSQSGKYEDVATTQTNDQGEYHFGTDLELLPGKYRVIETQPDGYLSVGATPGTVAGTKVGKFGLDGSSEPNILADIDIPLGGTHAIEYNFCEVRPASISGHVWHDRNDDGVMDPNEDPIANVEIRITRVGHKTPGAADPFADTEAIILRTNADGFYNATGLPPGIYEIVEVNNYPPGDNPLDGFIDGKDAIGVIGGKQMGQTTNDKFSQIELCAGDEGVQYNFGELKPVSLSGYVSVKTPDGDCLNPEDPNFQPIAGVTIELRDASGQLIDTTETNAEGHYRFDGLAPGTYSIVEIQPNAYLDGDHHLGNIDGTVTGDASVNDQFRGITLRSGDEGVRYDFCELEKPASIKGFVHADTDGNCEFDPEKGDRPLAGVRIALLDADGNLVARTQTNEDGFYSFEDLPAGTYTIREVTPAGYLDGGEKAGTIDGTTVGIVFNDRITNVVLAAGDAAVDYDFCEEIPAEIHGRVWEDGPRFQTQSGDLPANYRDQRDGVFQAGTDRPISNVKMYLWYFNDIDGGSLNPRAVTLADVLASEYPHMAGMPDDTPVYTTTDANGEYSFTGLKAGNYIVLQEQPAGYADANEIPGTTTGFSYNSEVDAALAPATLASTFSQRQLLDSINAIQVQSGGVSLENNFTEVTVVPDPQIPVNPPPKPPNPPRPTPPSPPLAGQPFLAGAQGINVFDISGTSVAIGVDAGQPLDFTWHLSVINAGDPRGDAIASGDSATVWVNASFVDSYQWGRADMDRAAWSFALTTDDGEIDEQEGIDRFGTLDGIPLAGDWNGDGIDEIGFFRDGYFYVDINGNREWDKDDLIAKLGDVEDQPVVGDWDGDGKDDIGIFGPIWPSDDEAIRREPGLPNPANRNAFRPKNVPPRIDEATDGSRVMRLSSTGHARADVIDHVFRYGGEGDIAITGDWNGNGIRSIGVFQNGTWRLDINGNGRLDANDPHFTFGEAGDIPVVGDFDADGIEEVGVFRDGTWIIDINGNRERDAQDKVFEMGAQGDFPVVGDWDGDGVDDPAVVRPAVTQTDVLFD